MQKAAIKIGARVRIAPQHWLRGYEEGRIIDHQLHLTNAWLVKFDRAFPGGGIEGDKLWLNESQFVEILSSAADSVPTGRGASGVGEFYCPDFSRAVQS